MVLDLKLPEHGRVLAAREAQGGRPALVDPGDHLHGKELTRNEETKLKKFAESIVVKDASSPERLLDETSLFLHRVERKLPKEKRRMLEQLHSADEVLKQRKILIVDDDVRNVFASQCARIGTAWRCSTPRTGTTASSSSIATRRSISC